MVVQLPELEDFVEEAKKAGAKAAYAALKTEYSRLNGLPFYRTRFVATAVGRVACHAGEPEKALLRWERDFGPTAADAASGGVPEDYRRRVEGFAGEARRRLAGAGFEVRHGEITAL